MTADERLLPYVSNLDRPVYAIRGLPEEVVAVIFAYVSRSPASFRDNLAKLLADDEVAATVAQPAPPPLARAGETARRFHEKWVVGYGHASVAEHATVHLGVEGISRLASAELELASSFLSVTEFSQRYQRPRLGAYAWPEELPPALVDEYRSFQEEAFSAYERLQEGLLRHHLAAGTPERQAEKLAFEDARYALPLAVHTALGLTANARALREAVVALKASPYAEVRRLAAALAAEASAALPTLLRYLEAEAVQAYAALPRPAELVLEEYTGQGSPQPLACALAALGLAQPDLAGLRAELSRLRDHGLPPQRLDQVRYRFRLAPSEAAWHQLLRHNRRTDFLYGAPEATLEVVVPPSVEQAGLAEELLRVAQRAERVYHRLRDASSPAAAYVVLNAHRRPVQASLSLRELVHLVTLRGAANAQWEIRGWVLAMRRAVEGVHPGLLASLVEVPEP